jgi:tetratricopeptide (TPR) repeat protein
VLQALRRALGLAGVLALVWAADRLLGRRAALGLAAGWVVALGLSLVILPRAAHRAFRLGQFGRAALVYRVLRACRVGRDPRAALRVSQAACLLGRERYRDGLAQLAAIEPASLGDTVRAAWLNNRSYALSRSGGDPGQALADIDQAIALRPDVPGFRHTRALALLGAGRLDDALRELDRLWAAGEETSPLLEAERCYDLGLAWRRKGERDYATDYFDRARRAAPESPWASRAAAEIGRDVTIPTPLAELL